MDDFIVSWLPDLTGWTLTDLFASDDPVLLAAQERLVEQLAETDPADGCC
jgi:hypothetical protein